MTLKPFELNLLTFMFLLGGKLVMHLLRKNTRGTAMQGVKVKRPSQFRKLAAR
jgi:hypothetical protein